MSKQDRAMCHRRSDTESSTPISRRRLLETLAVGSLPAVLLGCGRRPASRGRSADNLQQSAIGPQGSSIGMPGPYPGRVIEVGHAGSVYDGRRDSPAVKAMVAEGMQRLVPGAETSVDAWRNFFQKGDRVGIKVVPVGKVAKPGANGNKVQTLVDLQRPGSISSYELVAEVIDSLTTAGVRRQDILVFERYCDEFIQAGYVDMLPEGIHWECSSVKYDEAQLEIDGQMRGQSRRRNVAGYDRDVYRELAFCQPSDVHDSNDDRRFRSHLSKIVTQKVDKIISLPVLKDHRSAGVTLALKNMSHGLVNNVGRSHVVDAALNSGGLNHCQTFIPAAVSLGPTREKCVLQILDGLVGTYEGGPGNWNRSFATWEYRSLFFATDPVALDHVGWRVIDQKRGQMGWPSVAHMGQDAHLQGPPAEHHGATEAFHIRQPQHVPLAALLGLGTFDLSQIDYHKFDIA